MGKTRQSNIELLRIVSMIMIVILHADFFSLGYPNTGDIDLIPRVFFESLCTGAVNTFVLISGWFGIRPSKRGFFYLLFQCFFIIFTIYFICVIIGIEAPSLGGIRTCLMMGMDFWFIKAYIALYLISPALNLFVEKSDIKSLSIFLIAFYLFQSIYGWFVISTEWIAGGYSFFSFVGLYVLARTCKRIENKLNTIPSSCYLLAAYIGVIIIITGIAIIGIYYNQTLSSIMFAYSNPLVIVSSLLLVVWFSRLQIQSKTINWIAKSCLAVYLCHLHPSVVHYFKTAVQVLYQNESITLSYLYLGGFVIIVFFTAILIDKLRIVLWGVMQKKL